MEQTQPGEVVLLHQISALMEHCLSNKSSALGHMTYRFTSKHLVSTYPAKKKEIKVIYKCDRTWECYGKALNLIGENKKKKKKQV